MIDYDYKDFADLIGKDCGEAIASQRLLDAIKEIQKDTLEKDELVLNRLKAIEAKVDHFAACWEDEMDAIKTVEDKLDALSKLLSPCTSMDIQSFPQTNIPTVFTPPGPEIKSFAEKEYSDNTAPKEEK